MVGKTRAPLAVLSLVSGFFTFGANAWAKAQCPIDGHTHQLDNFGLGLVKEVGCKHEKTDLQMVTCVRNQVKQGCLGFSIALQGCVHPAYAAAKTRIDQCLAKVNKVQPIVWEMVFAYRAANKSYGTALPLCKPLPPSSKPPQKTPSVDDLKQTFVKCVTSPGKSIGTCINLARDLAWEAMKLIPEGHPQKISITPQVSACVGAFWIKGGVTLSGAVTKTGPEEFEVVVFVNPELMGGFCVTKDSSAGKVGGALASTKKIKARLKKKEHIGYMIGLVGYSTLSGLVGPVAGEIVKALGQALTPAVLAELGEVLEEDETEVCLGGGGEGKVEIVGGKGKAFWCPKVTIDKKGYISLGLSIKSEGAVEMTLAKLLDHTVALKLQAGGLKAGITGAVKYACGAKTTDSVAFAISKCVLLQTDKPTKVVGSVTASAQPMPMWGLRFEGSITTESPPAGLRKKASAGASAFFKGWTTNPFTWSLYLFKMAKGTGEIGSEKFKVGAQVEWEGSTKKPVCTGSLPGESFYKIVAGQEVSNFGSANCASGKTGEAEIPVAGDVKTPDTKPAPTADPTVSPPTKRSRLSLPPAGGAGSPPVPGRGRLFVAVAPSADPVGRWDGHSNNYKFAITIRRARSGLLLGYLTDGGGSIDSVRFDAASGVLEFRRIGSGWWQWYRLTVSGSTMSGTFSHEGEPGKPGSAAYRWPTSLTRGK